jgi:hypothetical protein
MATKNNEKPLPKGYVRLEGSMKRPAAEARLLRPADEKETFKITIVLRRRTDGPKLPDFDFYKTSPERRQRISSEEFAGKYGAHPDDLAKVVEFAENAGLKVVKTHLGRRYIKASGTVAQMSQAFSVGLGVYERKATRSLKGRRVEVTETYRGREGFIHVPKEIAPAIVGVFGLDNRRMVHSSGIVGDPPIANPLTMQQITGAYNFPPAGSTISGQTIGVVSASGGTGGYYQGDLDLYFVPLGLSPQIIPISIEGCENGVSMYPTSPVTALAGQTTLTFASVPDLAVGYFGYYYLSGAWTAFKVTAVPTTATVAIEVYDYSTGSFVTTGLPAPVPGGTPVYFNIDDETNQDICISGGASGGANVAVYFFYGDSAGWVDVINRVIEPEAGDFPAGVSPPSVLTFSYSMCWGDDPNGLAGLTVGNINAMSAAFQDAAAFAITVCCSTADFGSNSTIGRTATSDTPPITYVGDGFAHTVYPATDPWVLAVGGTTLGQYLPAGSTTPKWVEYAWNDPMSDPTYPWGTGGGGVSAFFTTVPSYQAGAGVPDSINTNTMLTPVAGATVPPPTPFFSATGRGIPDVAANASINTGFAGIYLAGQLSDPGNGTSASTPFWAGTIALLNANLGYNIGFVNPIFYEWGPSLFSPINPLWPDSAYPGLVLPLPAGCPVDNGNNGIPGYPAGQGWDACTGLGSPNPTALLAAFQELGNAYVLGGYQSPDIIITNITSSATGAAGTPVPLGGIPGSSAWDTLLVPNIPYGLQVTIHNGSTVDPTYIDSVSFWTVPGGVGTTGGTQIATINPGLAIPPGGSITVPPSYSTVQFTNPGSHACAVVSIYSNISGCLFNGAPDPVTNVTPPSQDIPDPGAANSHACSAWRNTDTMSAAMGGSYKFKLGFGEIPGKLRDPVVLRIDTAHIPFDVMSDPRIRQIQALLVRAGARSNVPIYLLPEFINRYRTADMKNRIAVTKGGKVEERDDRWLITPEARAKATAFEISGKVPGNARRGDVLLVNVTASYPKMGDVEARSVGFLEFIYVTGK